MDNPFDEEFVVVKSPSFKDKEFDARTIDNVQETKQAPTPPPPTTMGCKQRFWKFMFYIFWDSTIEVP